MTPTARRISVLACLILSLPAFETSSLAMSCTADFCQRPEYVTDWCGNVRAILKRTVRVADNAKTDAEAVVLLRSGMQNAAQVGTDRFKKFFRYTLGAALVDGYLFALDPSRQAFFLRKSINEALDDLTWLDGSWNPNDNGSYVDAMLRRAQSDGLRAPEDVQELYFLSNAAARAAYLIDQSDHRRGKGYACARETLTDSLNDSALPGMSSRTRVEILRSGINMAVEQIRNPYCY